MPQHDRWMTELLTLSLHGSRASDPPHHSFAGLCSDVGALLGYLRPAAPYVMPIAASALTFGLGLQATQVKPIDFSAALCRVLHVGYTWPIS
jgi:hypothetical protein